MAKHFFCSSICAGEGWLNTASGQTVLKAFILNFIGSQMLCKSHSVTEICPLFIYRTFIKVNRRAGTRSIIYCKNFKTSYSWLLNDSNFRAVIGGWTQLMFCLHLVCYCSVEDGKQHTQGCTCYPKRQILFHLFSLAFRLGSCLWIHVVLLYPSGSILSEPTSTELNRTPYITEVVHVWTNNLCISSEVLFLMQKPDPGGPGGAEPTAVPALLHEVGKHAEIKGLSSSGWWNSFERAPVALDFSAS